MITEEKQQAIANILVVDYGTGAAKALGLALRCPDVNVQWVTGNAEALRAVKEDLPDLALVDLTSGSNSGYLLAALLKNQRQFDPPSVVGISTMGGHTLHQMAPGLETLGFDRCVSLTWPLQRRVEAVEEVLGERCF